MPRHRLLHSQAAGRQGCPPSPPASPGCVLLLSPQPQAADGPKQTAAKEDHQTPGANQMSGNEKVAHEEYHLIRLHHLSKTDGLFIGLWQFWFLQQIPNKCSRLSHYSTCCSQVTVWKHCGLTHPRSEVVNLSYTLESSGGLWKCCLGPTIELVRGVQPGHRDFFLLKAPRRSQGIAEAENHWLGTLPEPSHLRSCNDAYWLQMAWDRFVGGCLLFVAFEWNASISLFFNSAGPHALFSLTSVGC